MPARHLVKKLGGEWHGSYGLAPCPVCQPEKRRNQHGLSISWKGGRLLLKCHKSDCSFKDIIAVIDKRDLPPSKPVPRTKADAEREEKRAEKAALDAEALVAKSERTTHEYLKVKGFEKLALPTISIGAVDRIIPVPKLFYHLKTSDRVLIFPLTDRMGRITSVQMISGDGAKVFLAGGRIGGSAWMPCETGRRPMILCEGVATGLSILRSSKRLGSIVSIAACMSAGGVLRMAKSGFGDGIVADNDASRTGWTVTRASNLLYVMPPELGTDFNDLERASPARADALLKTLAFGAEWTAVSGKPQSPAHGQPRTVSP